MPTTDNNLFQATWRRCRRNQRRNQGGPSDIDKALRDGLLVALSLKPENSLLRDDRSEKVDELGASIHRPWSSLRPTGEGTLGENTC